MLIQFFSWSVLLLLQQACVEKRLVVQGSLLACLCFWGSPVSELKNWASEVTTFILHPPPPPSHSHLENKLGNRSHNISFPPLPPFPSQLACSYKITRWTTTRSMMVKFLGLLNPTNGRSCLNHDCCGLHVRPSDVARLKREVTKRKAIPNHMLGWRP